MSITVEAFLIACTDCPCSWNNVDYGWVTASSSARRHAKLLGHALLFDQKRSWEIGSPT